jgi:excisionase family DNA binding protein
MNNKPMTTYEAAARLGLSPSHMARLAAAGRIPRASKPGRDWVFESPIEVLPPERPPGWPRRRPKDAP